MLSICSMKITDVYEIGYDRILKEIQKENIKNSAYDLWYLCHRISPESDGIGEENEFC